MTGRPSDYTEDLALTICSRIAEGESVRTISKDPAMPNASTIHRWVLQDVSGFRKQYEMAKQIGAEVESDEMDEIAITEEDVQRARLRIDVKKWNLSKKLPKRFGDKIDMTTNGKELPTPILSINPNVHTNDSHEENSESN